MRALICPAYGPVDGLRLTGVPDPVAGPGEVLVRVEAAALNPLDVLLVTGAARGFLPLEPPFVPGMEVAGTVVDTGPDVAGFGVGDEVLAWTYPGFGCLAEYVLVPAGPGLTHRPAGLTADRAAALPVGAMAAALLLAAAKVRPGDALLVDGASGGVGVNLVQLAANAGAEVFATASPEDAVLLRELGAHHVVDRGSDVSARIRVLRRGGVDVAVSLAHGTATADSVRDGGRLLSPVADPGTLGRGVTGEYVHIQLEPGDRLLPELAGLAADGRLRQVIDRRPFDDAVRVLTGFATGRHRGKTVLIR